MKRIKLKTCTLDWLDVLISQYKKYGYTLVEVRPKSFWKDFDFINDHVAIMEKE